MDENRNFGDSYSLTKATSECEITERLELRHVLTCSCPEAGIDQWRESLKIAVEATLFFSVASYGMNNEAGIKFHLCVHVLYCRTGSISPTFAVGMMNGHGHF